MAKFKRGNYVFNTWIGDHGPRHVHIYAKGKLVVKWDLENGLAMKGHASKRIKRLITELQEEGLL